MRTYTTICACCGIIFESRSVLAAYCNVNCRVRAAYCRKTGKPVGLANAKRRNNWTQPIRPQVVQPTLTGCSEPKLLSDGTEQRVWNGTAIQRREADGFVNATAMCKANGKLLADYTRLARTQEYMAALANVVGEKPCGAAVVGNPITGPRGSMGNPITADLIHTIQGGTPALQGTWIHPRLAIDLARWISPAFAVWMDGWFLETIAQPAPSPAAAPLKPGVHVVAESRREACRLWKEAIQSEVQGAIDRALGWKHCSEQTLPLAVNYNVTTTA